MAQTKEQLKADRAYRKITRGSSPAQMPLNFNAPRPAPAPPPPAQMPLNFNAPRPAPAPAPPVPVGQLILPLTGTNPMLRGARPAAAPTGQLNLPLGPPSGPASPPPAAPPTPAAAPQAQATINQAGLRAKRLTPTPSPGTPTFTGPMPQPQGGVSVGGLARGVRRAVAPYAAKAAAWAQPVLIGAEVGRRMLLPETEDRRRVVRDDITGYLMDRGLSPEEAYMFGQEYAGSAQRQDEETQERVAADRAQMRAAGFNRRQDRADARGYDPYDAMIRAGTKGVSSVGAAPTTLGRNQPAAPAATTPAATTPAGETQGQRTLSFVSGRSPEMQARVDQNVAMLDRQTDALRQLREARNPSGGGSGDIVGVSPPGVFDRPGDSFGDRQMREQRYEGLLRDAANQRGFGARRRGAAMVDAAEQMRAPGETAVAADTARQQTQAGERAARMQAESGERTAQTNRLTQLESASVAQLGKVAVEQMKGDADAQKRAEERRTESHVKQAQLLKEAGAEDVADFYVWLEREGLSVLGQMGYTPDQWKAFRSQPTAQETLKWYALYKQRPQPGFIARTLGTGPTLQEQADRLQGN